MSKEEVELEKKRKLLLLLAILVVTITYQAGLTPPGKFWLEHGSGDEAHKVGDPVLADNYPRRYKAFFYSNSTSFMASVAVTVFLLSRNLSNTGTRYWTALYFCMGASFIGLMCAYTASTMLTVRASSIFVVALVAVVLVFTSSTVATSRGGFRGGGIAAHRTTTTRQRPGTGTPNPSTPPASSTVSGTGCAST